jgi:glycosyltransferase involved in cell wall biosynthesis
MTLRILHLIATFGKGGAERQLSLLAPAMAREGLSVCIAYHTGGPNLQALKNADISLVQLPTRHNHDPRRLTDISIIANNFQPDIIQTWLLQMDVIGGIVAHLRGTPHVLSERSSSAAYQHPNWKQNTRVMIGRRAQAIVANSDGGLKYWSGLGARGELRVIRNIATPPIPNVPANDFGLNGKRLLLAACRLSHEKNVPVIVNTLAIALRNLPEHHAILFGDGPQRANTKAMIASTGLSDRLHLGGYTAELSWWMQRSDAFLSASLVEGHPNVVIEAAFAQCPMVLSDIPAHREFTVDDSALFAKASDAPALALALTETVLNQDLARARAQRALSLTNALTTERAVLGYTEIYKTLTNKTHHR